MARKGQLYWQKAARKGAERAEGTQKLHSFFSLCPLCLCRVKLSHQEEAYFTFHIVMSPEHRRTVC